MRSLVLRSPLSPHESRARLEGAAERDIPILTEMKFSYGVIVHGHGGRVWLRVRRPFVNNFLSPWLLVLCRPTLGGRGSLVDIRLRYEPLAVALTVVAALFAAFFGSVVFIRATRDILGGQNPLGAGNGLFVFLALVMAGWPVFLVWLGARDRRALLDFVAETVEATPTHGLTSRLSGPA